VNITLLVVAIVVGILIVQVLVWIPLIVWFRRRSRVAAGRLAAELEGQTVVRAPEKGIYRGATAPGFPAVNGNGLIALTRRWPGTSPPPAKVGEHVSVRYDPANPYNAVIDQYWQIWFLPTLLGILGAPFLLLGFAMLTFGPSPKVAHAWVALHDNVLQR
jgi:hypothetical protein